MAGNPSVILWWLTHRSASGVLAHCLGAMSMGMLVPARFIANSVLYGSFRVHQHRIEQQNLFQGACTFRTELCLCPSDHPQEGPSVGCHGLLFLVTGLWLLGHFTSADPCQENPHWPHTLNRLLL